LQRQALISALSQRKRVKVQNVPGYNPPSSSRFCPVR